MNLLFILQKIARALLTILLLVTTVFVVLRLTGDPAVYVLGLDADPLALDAFRHRWGLDQPIMTQFFQFLKNCLQGDFGYSYFEERDAFEAVLERLPATLLLMGLTGFFTLLIGIPAGIYAALHRNTWVDRLTILVSVAGFSMPGFVLGIFLILLLSVTWQLLPTSGSGTWQHLVMPVLTMTVAEAAVFARFTRSAMLEQLNQPYMRTARAKGLTWHQVVYRHAVPNAAIPLITVIGFFVGTLVAGGVVTESLFAWPGLGRLLVSSVANRDLAVVQIIVMLIATSMVLTNLVIDLLYGWLDPRVASLRAGE
jgi:peptide/nickel transport system permease protein